MNLTAAANYQKEDGSGMRLGQKGQGLIVRGGLRRSWLELGETRFAVDFTRAWDITSDDDRATSFGAMVMQMVDWLGMRFYAGYRTYKVSDRGDVNLEDIQVFTSGVSLDFESTWGFD